MWNIILIGSLIVNFAILVCRPRTEMWNLSCLRCIALLTTLGVNLFFKSNTITVLIYAATWITCLIVQYVIYSTDILSYKNNYNIVKFSNKHLTALKKLTPAENWKFILSDTYYNLLRFTDFDNNQYLIYLNFYQWVYLQYKLFKSHKSVIAGSTVTNQEIADASLKMIQSIRRESVKNQEIAQVELQKAMVETKEIMRSVRERENIHD